MSRVARHLELVPPPDAVGRLVERDASAAAPYVAGLLRYAASERTLVCLVEPGVDRHLDGFRAVYPDRYVASAGHEETLELVRRYERTGATVVAHLAVGSRSTSSLAASATPPSRARFVALRAAHDVDSGLERQLAWELSAACLHPGLTVVDAVDRTEVVTALSAVSRVDGCIYLRLPRGFAPNLVDWPLAPGEAQLLSTGRDLCLLSSALATHAASEAAVALREDGIGVTHLHVTTLRPFDDLTVAEAIAACRAVVVVNDGFAAGGLGSAVAETIATGGLRRPLRRFGTLDADATSRRGDRRTAVQLTQTIASAARDLLDRSPFGSKRRCG